MRRVVSKLAIGVKKLIGTSDISFRLCHRTHVQKDERLTQMMVCAEPADAVRRRADNRTRLATPRAFAIGPGADIDGVLQGSGNRSIVFRRNEENGVSSPNPLAK
jgi:hypothetical protein